MDASTSASQPQSKQTTLWRRLLLMAMTAIGPAMLNILVPAGADNRVRTDSIYKQPISNKQASSPVFFVEAPGGRLSSSVPSKIEGMEHRAAHQSFRPAAPPPGTRAPLGAPSRLFCPRGRNFRTQTRGPRPLLSGGLSPAFIRAACSPRRAAPRSWSGRLPGASRTDACEVSARAPRPTPPSRRLMKAPSIGWDDPCI